MSWRAELSDTAERQLKRLPRDVGDVYVMCTKVHQENKEGRGGYLTGVGHLVDFLV